MDSDYRFPKNNFNSQHCTERQQSHYPNNDSAFHEGDIIEVSNTNGIQEYMVFVGCVGSKQNVLYASFEAAAQAQSPSMLNKWVTGYAKTEDLSFSRNSQNFKNGAIQRIAIHQGSVDEVIGNRGYKKNNFENVNLEPNYPEAIVDRAMFKVLDSKASPHFQNSKDWVIWCRFGRDIITREVHVPSHLGFAAGSGKY